MLKRKLKEVLPPNAVPSTKIKKRRSVKVFDNPWKVAKGVGQIKLVDVIYDEEWEESANQNPSNRSNSSCNASSPGRFARSSSSKKPITSFRNKLELAYPMSQHEVEWLSKRPGGGTDLKPCFVGDYKNSLNETLVSVDSLSLDTQNTPPESLKKTCGTSLTKYDNGRDHTKESSAERRHFGRETEGKRKNHKPSVPRDFRQFMCPTAIPSSIRKTPPQCTGAYSLRVLSPILGSENFTPVDQPVAKKNLVDMNEMLMASRLMQVEKKAKERQKKAVPFHKVSSGRVLLPAPPMNCFFVKSDEDAVVSNTLPYKTSKPEYGRSSKFLREYKILGKIGKGSYGTVLKVVSRYDGCTYAVKKCIRCPSL